MKRSLLTLLTPLVVLAACGDDATGPTGDRLTREEALLVAGQVIASGDQTTATAQQGAVANARIDPRSFSQDLTVTAPCPAGGSVRLSFKTDLSFDESIGSLDVDVEGSLLHDACAFPHEGITITVSGNPDIDLDAHARLRNFQPSGDQTFSVAGSFRWSTSDGRSGTCPISIDAVTKFTAKTRTIEGEVCGHSWQETVTWS